VRDFWPKEFENCPKTCRLEAIAPIQNKGGVSLKSFIRAILVQPKSSFDLRQILDEGKIFLVNLAKGRVSARTPPDFLARSSSRASGSPVSAAPTCGKTSGAIFTSILMSSRISPPSAWDHALRAQEIPG
jgi:hypothetical protein